MVTLSCSSVCRALAASCFLLTGVSNTIAAPIRCEMIIHADGVAFDAEESLSQNPQWNWQQGYLRSRPSRPWVLFNST